jgi:hypothetical protein
MSDAIWQLLEETAPKGCESVQDLYSWSLNYDAGKGPFTLFLDLIGYSFEEFGDTLYQLTESSLGYVELGKLALALTEYADRPSDVHTFITTLIEAEMES